MAAKTNYRVLTATSPIAAHPVKEIYTFEVPSSTEWAFGEFQRAFRANVFVDISNTLETKRQAMQVYESEARGFPHPRSPDALRAIHCTALGECGGFTSGGWG